MFFNFRWVPSHTNKGDGHDEELVSADDRSLNDGADDLASRGTVLNRPPQPSVDGAHLRVQLTETLQIMLVTIHIMRKKLEAARIAGLLAAKRIIALPCGRPPPLISMDVVRVLVPNYCFNPGSSLLRVQSNCAFTEVRFDLRSRRKYRPLEAMKWYSSRLQWPSDSSESNRGASWIEWLRGCYWLSCCWIYSFGPYHAEAC